MDPASTSVEAVENLVEKELAAHNKPKIQVRHYVYIHSNTNFLFDSNVSGKMSF